MYILGTLTPNDYFTGIWYNSRREFVLSDCCTTAEQQFLPATTRNKRLFRRFLERIEERDQASLPVALNMSFMEFLKWVGVVGLMWVVGWVGGYGALVSFADVSPGNTPSPLGSTRKMRQRVGEGRTG